MKNKGYTLIELLAVMIILASLIVIIFPSIINFVKKTNDKKQELTLDLVSSITETYIKDNNKKFPSIYGNTYCISINTLLENNYLKGKMEYQGKDASNMSVKATYNDEFNFEIVNSNSCYGVSVTMAPNLTPVIYNGENWIVADIENQEWFNYDNQEWANVVILNSGITKKIGDTVTVDGTNPDALAMFVWIPRYSYTIGNTYGVQLEGGSTPSAATPGAIDIKFINTSINETGTASYTGNTPNNWKTHPAFTFGLDEVSGIWVGKFEISHNILTSASLNCSNETCDKANDLRILPNVQALCTNSISSFFYGIRSMSMEGNIFGIDSEITNSHMIKNSEWGAVAYLSQSKYGKYGNDSYEGANKEVYQNKSSSYTGNSNGTPSQNEANEQYVYNDASNNLGIGASTTGNITGIYDMSGGSWEYVMGVFANAAGDIWSGSADNSHSGFSGKLGENSLDYTGVNFPKNDIKYYDLYKASSDITITIDSTCENGSCYGHALNETNNWYSDTLGIVKASSPWFIRGGTSSASSNSGLFNAYRSDGAAHSAYSTRVILTPINQ